VVLTRHAVEHLLHTSGRGRCGGGSATQAPEPPAGAAALAGGPRGDAAGRRAAGDRWRRRAAVGSGRRPLHRAARHGARADVRPPGLRDRARHPAGPHADLGDIAARLGDPGAAREVGQALGRNPFAVIVPCHRVIAAGGKTGGFSATGGVTTKLRLLEIERARRAASRPCSTRTRRSRGCNAAGSGWSTAKKVARYLLFSSPIPCFDRDGHSFVL
jgi:O-6-methylguanine DNA methyltransferase